MTPRLFLEAVNLAAIGMRLFWSYFTDLIIYKQALRCRGLALPSLGYRIGLTFSFGLMSVLTRLLLEGDPDLVLASSVNLNGPVFWTDPPKCCHYTILL